jgi:hypothetical protein
MARWSFLGGIAVIRQKLDAALDVWFFHTPAPIHWVVCGLIGGGIAIGLEELARSMGILAALAPL